MHAVNNDFVVYFKHHLTGKAYDQLIIVYVLYILIRHHVTGKAWPADGDLTKKGAEGGTVSPP